MRNFLIYLFLIISSFVISKSSTLTESMGYEVIEIGPSIKELPPGLEEEPSVENNEEDVQSTTTTPQPTTKQDIKKATATATNSTSNTTIKDALAQEDDEVKIEKELADMYKDNSDYKSDSNEIITDAPTSEVGDVKPVARQRNSFKFQPDEHNRAEVERFRTSVDEISCEKRSTEKLSAEEPLSQSASKCFIDFILGLIPLILLY